MLVAMYLKVSLAFLLLAERMLVAMYLKVSLAFLLLAERMLVAMYLKVSLAFLLLAERMLKRYVPQSIPCLSTVSWTYVKALCTSKYPLPFYC